MPLKLMRDLRAAPVVNEWDIGRRRGSITLAWTEKRRRTLALMAEGWLDKQIAVDQGVSVSTVKSQIKAVLALLEAKNRAHAVHLGHMQGLL